MHDSDVNGTIALTAQYGLSFNVGLSVHLISANTYR